MTATPQPFGHAFRDSEAVFAAWRQARNYRHWIFEKFHPYLGHEIAEVGAGLGWFTRELCALPETRITALEPCLDLFERQRNEWTVPNVNLVNSTLPEYQSGAARTFDSIVYLNVLEHIDDDVDELKSARSLLKPNGHLCIFVPANEWLYNDFDKKCGHFRRYSKSGLNGILKRAGFRAVRIEYFDIFGILPWLLLQLLGSHEMRPFPVWLYDRFFIPPLKFIEQHLWQPTIGKNLVAIAVPDDH